MTMHHRLVSAVLTLGLLGGVGCGPEQEVPTPASPEPVAPAPEAAPRQEEDTGTVQAMSVTNITWADFTKTETRYVATCATSPYNHTCSFCASSGLYNAEYAASGCTSPNDVMHLCVTCDRVVNAYTARVELPDGDLIDYTIEHNVASSDVVEFKLESAPSVTWWKQVSIIGRGETWRVWNHNGGTWCDYPYPETAGCNTNSQWAATVADPNTYFLFSKAKFLGIHTDMYELHNLSQQLTGGDRVTFRWVQE